MSPLQSPLPLSRPSAGTIEVVQTGKTTASLHDADSHVVLNISQAKREVSFIEPASGKTVVMVILTEMGNFFTIKSTTWAVWCSHMDGGALETGSSMYKLGSFQMSPSGGPLEYLDDKGKMVLCSRLKSESKAIVYGPDGVSPAAVVEGMFTDKPALQGKCTFAKGVDPIVAFAMSTAAPFLLEGSDAPWDAHGRSRRQCDRGQRDTHAHAQLTVLSEDI